MGDKLKRLVLPRGFAIAAFFSKRKAFLLPPPPPSSLTLNSFGVAQNGIHHRLLFRSRLRTPSSLENRPPPHAPNDLRLRSSILRQSHPRFRIHFRHSQRPRTFRSSPWSSTQNLAQTLLYRHLGFLLGLPRCSSTHGFTRSTFSTQPLSGLCDRFVGDYCDSDTSYCKLERIDCSEILPGRDRECCESGISDDHDELV